GQGDAQIAIGVEKEEDPLVCLGIVIVAHLRHGVDDRVSNLPHSRLLYGSARPNAIRRLLRLGATKLGAATCGSSFLVGLPQPAAPALPGGGDPSSIPAIPR